MKKMAVHNGTFHADDVFGVALMQSIYNNLEVIRTRDEELLKAYEGFDVDLLKELKEDFGEEIALLVDGVTKMEKTNFSSKEESEMETHRKILHSITVDARIIVVKLADRLHNMRTLKYMSPEKAKYKAKETLEIYGGIANRLGISMIKWELEDLALRYIDPEGYYELVEKVAKKRSQREFFGFFFINFSVQDHLQRWSLFPFWVLQVLFRKAL